MLLALVVLGLTGAWVAADARPRSGGVAVGLSPSTITLMPGQTATVDVVVYNVENLAGFDIRLIFNPSVLTVLDSDPWIDGVNIAWGDFISPDWPALDTCDNANGTIQAAVTQFGGSRSGTGVLLSITFQALAAGDSGLSFESVQLSDSKGSFLSQQVLAHNYTVVDPTPTGTGTPQATATSTPGGVHTATATPTTVITPTLTPTASPTPYFYLEPQHVEFVAGQTAQMHIRTSFVENLSGVEVHLQFDPAHVQVVDAEPAQDGVQLLPGDLFVPNLTFCPTGGNTVDNGSGRITYALTLLPPPTAMTGEWTVATIIWRAPVGAQGPCAVRFVGNNRMASPSTGDIPSGSIDGQVQVWVITATPTAAPTGVPSPTPTVLSCGNVVQNGSFEVQHSGAPEAWYLLSGASLTDSFAHDGRYSVWLGGYDGASDQVYTVVTIPVEAVSASLTYWHRMETWETQHPNDYLYVELRRQDGQLLATLETLDDGGSTNQWVGSTSDLLAYKGQALRLCFRASTNAQRYSSFYVDDVRVQVCTPGVGPVPTQDMRVWFIPAVFKGQNGGAVRQR